MAGLVAALPLSVSVHANSSDSFGTGRHAVGTVISTRTLGRQSPDRYVSLLASNLGIKRNLCTGVAGFDLPAPGYCSGFLAAPDLFVTAGHCIRSSVDCSNTAIVFDFMEPLRLEAGVVRVAADNIFRCKALVAHKLDHRLGVDFAVIRLDRAAVGRQPLSIRRTGSLELDDKVQLFSHPNGTPLMVGPPTPVTDINPEYFFRAPLRSHIGASGAPVINVRTQQVEGILVRGGLDYVYRDGCNEPADCSQSVCKLDDVLRSETFASLIPPLGPWFKVQSIGVDDRAGNGDRYADPGETVRLILTIQSNGTHPLPAGRLRASQTIDGKEAQLGMSVLPPLKPAETYKVFGFSVSIPKDFGCDQPVPFRLDYSANKQSLELAVHQELRLGQEVLEKYAFDEINHVIPDDKEGLVLSREITANPRGRPVRFLINARHPDASQLTLEAMGPDGRSALIFHHAQPHDGRRIPYRPPPLSGVYGRDLVPYQSIDRFSRVDLEGKWALKIADHVRGAQGMVYSAEVLFVSRTCKEVP